MNIKHLSFEERSIIEVGLFLFLIIGIIKGAELISTPYHIYYEIVSKLIISAANISSYKSFIIFSASSESMLL